MTKINLGMVALAAALLAGGDTNSAQAGHGFSRFGVHLGGRNVHVDIGNPHGRYYGSAPQVVYRRSYSNPQWYGHGGSAHYDWHDTSHYDYHPGEYRRHGNHLDYVPGHYDWHEDGHWDRHRGGHHGGGHH
jgi:hypothetical protein